MQSTTVGRALSALRNDDPDDYVPFETLATLGGALRRASTRTVVGRNIEAAIEAVVLAAELARECGFLAGDVVNADELGERLHDAVARAHHSAGSTIRAAWGPADYAAAQDKVEELIRGYAKGLRQFGGSLSAGALAALQAEAIELAGNLANAIDEEQRR